MFLNWHTEQYEIRVNTHTHTHFHHSVWIRQFIGGLRVQQSEEKKAKLTCRLTDKSHKLAVSIRWNGGARTSFSFFSQVCGESTRKKWCRLQNKAVYSTNYTTQSSSQGRQVTYIWGEWTRACGNPNQTCSEQQIFQTSESHKHGACRWWWV